MVQCFLFGRVQSRIFSLVHETVRLEIDWYSLVFSVSTISNVFLTRWSSYLSSERRSQSTSLFAMVNWIDASFFFCFINRFSFRRNRTVVQRTMDASQVKQNGKLFYRTSIVIRLTGAVKLFAHFQFRKNESIEFGSFSHEIQVRSTMESVCGDDSCDIDQENCSICPQDCGFCTSKATTQSISIVIVSLLLLLLLIGLLVVSWK